MLEVAVIFEAQSATETSEVLDVAIKCRVKVVDLVRVEAQTVPKLETRALRNDLGELVDGVFDGGQCVAEISLRGFRFGALRVLAMCDETLKDGSETPEASCHCPVPFWSFFPCVVG